MTRDLPPFSAVHGFEAAARHLSFRKAAEELNVTQSAISHRVKSLEEFLGVSLFRRTPHRIDLTSSGRSYLAEVSHLLDALDESTQRIRDAERTKPLVVRSTPAFAARWLVPRIDRFNAVYPEIELHVSTILEQPDFTREDVDVHVQYGQAPSPGLRVEPFLSSVRFPVCIPDLLECGPPLRAPEDLQHYTLLHDMVGDDWENWFHRAGHPPVEKGHGPWFEHCHLTLCAAERGQGVALAYGELIRQELEDGQLVRLFDIETTPKVVYSITCPEQYANRPNVAAFRNWLFEEIERSPGTDACHPQVGQTGA